MAHLDNLRQLAQTEMAEQSPSQPVRHGYDQGRLGRASAGRKEIEGCGKITCHGPEHVSSEGFHVPRRGDDVDIADIETAVVKRRLQREKRELPRMLLAV